MQKQISYKIASLVFGVLILCFAIAFYAVGWTEPSTAPPGDNVDAPVNVGSTEQVKQGGFGVYGVFRAIGGADPGTESGLVVSNGKVGIGTTSPQVKLHVYDGNIKASHSSLNSYVFSDAGPGRASVFELQEDGIRKWTIWNEPNTDQLYFSDGSGAHRIVINPISGNVGIGTTTPEYPLDIYGTDSIRIRGGSISSAEYLIHNSGGFTIGRRLKNGTGWDWSFRIDSQTGNVGIGTTNPSPEAKLEVAGQIKITGGSPGVGKVLISDAAGLASWGTITGALPAGASGQTLRHDGANWIANNNLFNNGTNIGIGTTNPQARLEITGVDNTNLLAFPGGVKLLYREGDYPDYPVPELFGFNFAAPATNNSFFLYTEEGGYNQALYFGDGYDDDNVFGISTRRGPEATEPGSPYDWTPRFVVNQGGNVGIGTTEPQGKLDVNGAIYQRGSALHADYVFEPDYELESIEEHAEYMWQNKHLKGVPRAQKDEAGQDVLEIGAYRRGMLEELEKAHVYIQQLNERINLLEMRLRELER